MAPLLLNSLTNQIKCAKFSWATAPVKALPLLVTYFPTFFQKKYVTVSIDQQIMLLLQTKLEREIKHMQYIAWPDHGVPDSPKMFLRFTEYVREARSDSPAPIIVHCSAGIGRTGVLVLMESALCLIEAGEPVYPLDIVQQMRKQRAMMIQNAVSVLLDDLLCGIW